MVQERKKDSQNAVRTRTAAVSRNAETNRTIDGHFLENRLPQITAEATHRQT